MDSAFARFNTIITSIKALDEGYSSKNYVRKFLRALHPKWRVKVMAIEESKDLTSLSLDELIENLKVHEIIIKKDSEIVKEKVERKSLALKAKKESSDEECEDLNHLIGECPKPPRDKNQRAFVGGSWSDSGKEDDEKIQDETSLVAQAPNEVCSESSYFSDENSSIDDLALDNEYDKLCKMSLKIITKNKRLKAIRISLENELRELKDKLSILEKNKGVDLDCAKCLTLKIENEKLKEESTRLNKFEKSTHCLNEMLSNQKHSGDKLGIADVTTYDGQPKFFSITWLPIEVTPKIVKPISLLINTLGIEESLNVTFDETPPPSKTSPLVDDDLDEEEAIREIEKKNLENVVEDETLEIDKIGLVPQALRNMTIIRTKWVFRNKLDENGVVSRNKARLVAQGYNQQEGIDYDETYAPVARLESIRILLAYACALDFKLFQIDGKSAFLNGFINEEVYVAQPPRFIDFKKPYHVYKLKKALYGLKQAPKAWYDRLKAFLIKHEYKMGMVDNTLFTKKNVGSRNTSLHRIKHEIGTRNEKERVVLERETREREREMREKRKDIIRYFEQLHNFFF
ncbi:copia protein [Tanacetum coccineum]